MPRCPIISVWPSGAAFAAASEPIEPPAPGRLSISTDCARPSESFCARARARISVEPPGGKGTIRRIGREG